MKRKAEFRSWAKNLRQELNLETAGKEIIKKVISLDAYKSAKTVMSYLPKKIEISLSDLLLDNSKKWFLPVVFKRDLLSPMLLVVPYIHTKTKLSKGAFGILEPQIEQEVFFDQLAKRIEIDLIFVPGLCFDTTGSRIGFGMGFYDNFLKLNESSFKIGTCPKECLVSNLPQDPHDIKVDLVITD